MNKIMAAVCYNKESQFHNGTGPIFELAVFNSKLHVCAVSLSKISHIIIVRQLRTSLSGVINLGYKYVLLAIVKRHEHSINTIFLAFAIALGVGVL